MPTVAESPAPVQFDTAILEAAQRAQAAYPDERPRIDKGLQIVLANQIELLTDGLALVQSQTHSETVYAVNGHCECKDAQYGAPDGRCQHRWAKSLLRWTLAQVQEGRERVLRDVVSTSTPGLLEIEPEPTTQGIRPEWIQRIHGKAFIRYAGLLALAHERGLQSLKARLTVVTESLAVAEAEAGFSDGRTFGECADATPSNVNRGVAAHFARCALTRAKARCLRDALNIDMVSVEEMADE